MATKQIKKHIVQSIRINRTDEDMECTLDRLGEEITPRQTSDGDNPFMYQKDLEQMFTFGKKLLKYGWHAVSKTQKSTWEVETETTPEFYAVYRVPCSTINMSVLLTSYSTNKVIIKLCRSDLALDLNAIEKDEKLYDLLEHNIEYYNIKPDGTFYSYICENEGELAHGIVRVLYQYRELCRYAKKLAEWELEITDKELELLKEWKQNFEKILRETGN